MFFLTFFFVFLATIYSLPLFLGNLLASDRLGRTLARSRVRVGPLAPHGQAASMTEPPVAADVHQHLDVLVDLSPEIALDLVVALDDLSQADRLRLRQMLRPGPRVDRGLLADLQGLRATDAVDIGQRNLDPLVSRQVDTCNACHDRSYVSSRPPSE